MRTIKTILAIMMIAALCAGGVVLAEEPTAKIITPNNPEIDIEALADGEYPAAFEPAALADGELTFTVYWEDTFDVVEIRDPFSLLPEGLGQIPVHAVKAPFGAAAAVDGRIAGNDGLMYPVIAFHGIPPEYDQLPVIIIASTHRKINRRAE